MNVIECLQEILIKCRMPSKLHFGHTKLQEQNHLFSRRRTARLQIFQLAMTITRHSTKNSKMAPNKKTSTSAANCKNRNTASTATKQQRRGTKQTKKTTSVQTTNILYKQCFNFVCLIFYTV